MTPATTIDWSTLKQNVNASIDWLKVCWEGTAKGDPEVHAMLVRDLYRPLIRQLAEFCASIDVQTEPRQ